MKVLCVFGKHQYGKPARGIGTEYAAFIPALKSLGCEVVHFESWDRDCYSGFAELNMSLISTVEREEPDIIFSVQMGYEIWIETLQIIRAMGKSALVCWTTDDSWKYREFSRFVGNYYHVMTTTYEVVLPAYHKDGIKNVLLTQWAAGSNYLKDPLPAAECRYPVSFIGMAHGDRKKRISRLRAKGIEVACFGYGWNNDPLGVEDMFDVYRNSKICINFGNSKGINQIKARNFEVPGAGGFLITEQAPGLEKFFDLGREIETYKGLDELISKINHYLGHPEERDRIARAGNQRVRQDHTYERRMGEILSFTLEAKKQESPGMRINSVKFSELETRHQVNGFLRGTRKVLVVIFSLIFGPTRGPRAARRLLFELSWRYSGEKTFSASGLPGRFFYHESQGRF